MDGNGGNDGGGGGERPWMRNTAGWACQRCKSTFLSENYRNRHIRTNACFWRRHEDDKYHCPYRGCGATFARTDTCARHVARVHAVIPSHFGEDEEEGPDGETAEDMEEGGDSGAAASAAAAAAASPATASAGETSRGEKSKGGGGGGGRRWRETTARRVFPCEECPHVSLTPGGAREHRQAHFSRYLSRGRPPAWAGGASASAVDEAAAAFLPLQSAHRRSLQHHR
jgi:hypothetical protein